MSGLPTRGLRPERFVRALFARVVVCAGAAVALACSAPQSRSALAAGFWFGDQSFVLPSDTAMRLGGPLTAVERKTIEQVARRELEQAFSGLRVRVSSDENAFWRVEVLSTIPPRGRQLPSAGESLALGPFGGRGAVSLLLVALKAIAYASPGASREMMLAAIGRGVGRVAVHEFAHQMLGATAGHNDADRDSYEYSSPDRASQYYGELHWSTAREPLRKKFGK